MAERERLTPDKVLRWAGASANKEYEPWVVLADGSKHAWSDLARQLLACREALRYYADNDRWQEFMEEERASAFDRDVGSYCGHDLGEKARACLPEYQKEADDALSG